MQELLTRCGTFPGLCASQHLGLPSSAGGSVHNAIAYFFEFNAKKAPAVISEREQKSMREAIRVRFRATPEFYRFDPAAPVHESPAPAAGFDAGQVSDDWTPSTQADARRILASRVSERSSSVKRLCVCVCF